ncbi:MAG: GNAT family N-acetyltransferase [Candidatus Promineifilaceae bacterium]|nr:GNAT family N-acetyltransferase [Candidatus Promineifilaceae bacterium]
MMSEISFRPAVPTPDFPALAALLSKVWPQMVTAGQMHEWEERQPAGQIRLRFVAEKGQAGIIGYGLVYHEASGAEGRFLLDVIIDPQWRNRGIGGKLYDHILSVALDHGANFLDCELSDNCPECLRFARKRGFIIDRHMFESVLDLASFDYNHFQPIIFRLESEGIRFISLASGGDTAALRRQLYEIDRQSALDDPASKGTFPTFEEFSRQVFEASWFRPEGQMMALDGQKVIGLSAVGYFTHNNRMYNMTTGVLPAYRGRQIAQALKILALRYAQSYGAQTVIAHNDSQNKAMLAINRKLGYRSQPGDYRMIKDLMLAAPIEIGA